MSSSRGRLVRLVAATAAAGLAAALVPLSALPASAATTIHVDDGNPSCGTADGSAANPYCTIQQGVDAAAPGDVVQVDDGTYNELVRVDKAIFLYGEQQGVDARDGRPGALESVIDGTGRGGAVFVTAPDVVLDGFTIRNVDGGLNSCVNAYESRTRVLANIVERCVIGISPGGSGSEVARNLTREITNPGAASGTHIYTDDITVSLSIHDNHLVGVTGDSSTGVNLAAAQAAVHLDPSVRGNHFDGIDTGVVALGTDGLLVDANRFDDLVGNGVYLGDVGTGFVNVDPTITGNGFDIDAEKVRAAARRAILLASVAGTVLVESNTIAITSGDFPADNGGTALHGIVLGDAPNGDTLSSPSSVVIRGNTLDGGDADTETGTDDSAGIRIGPGHPPAVNTDITCNVLTGWVDGIQAELQSGTDVDAFDNDIVRNGAAGASNTGAGVLDAEGNWWGAPNGPGPIGSGDDIEGNVDPVPWRTTPSSCAPGAPPTLPRITITDSTVTEGDSGTVNAAFTVKLSEASPETVTVQYATQNGTAKAGSDYVPKSGTVTFAPGDTSEVITVQVKGDTLDEPNETFRVNLHTPKHALIQDGRGIGTIVDDDPPPALRVRDANVTEGDSGTRNLNFLVSLSKPSAFTVTVRYTTGNGSAVAGSDFVAKSGTLTFSPGQTSKTVAVQVKGDTVREPNESLFLFLSNATNAGLADPNASGGILNDD